MKTRISFVANSSSSSFIIGLDKNCVKFIEAIVTISGCSRTKILFDNKQDIIDELRAVTADDRVEFNRLFDLINTTHGAVLMVDVALGDNRTRDAFGALMFNKGITIIIRI